MASKLPRYKCPGCERDVAGRATKRTGYAALVDHKRNRRDLVLCPWSESHVPVKDALAFQDELPQDQDTPVIPEQRIERLPLF
jgi:hypothetical protein